MTDGQKVVAVGGLAFVGWYLYTRQQGLTLTGEYANPMLAPARNNQQSLVTQNTSTSTAATNVFTSAVSSVLKSFGSLFRTNANQPTRIVPNAAGIAANEQGPPATGTQYATPGQQIPAPNTSLAQSDPFWMWDYSFELPSSPGVPDLDWTLPPDANYIPPPPGS